MLEMKTVYIPLTGFEYTSVAKMFSDAGWNVSHENGFTEHGVYPETAAVHVDLVCFTGGSDVSPHLYGEENTHSYCDPKRDEFEQKVYEHFVGKVPFVGICRGGQFLNVMNGGKMIQHIDGHSMGIHAIRFSDIDNDKPYQVLGDHHQVMVPVSDYWGPVMESVKDGAYEAFFYQKTKCLCFQPHPEWGHEPTRELFFELVEEYIGL